MQGQSQIDGGAGRELTCARSYIYASGETYEGDYFQVEGGDRVACLTCWDQDRAEGQGTYEWPNGETYKGEEERRGSWRVW